jgi:4-amino-4-deoxy-L-arabinose transferase-like glycosyltransferase
MWSGGSLLRPYLDPQTPYFNKPPAALLIHGWFLKTFGRDLVAARAPSILAALGVVLFTVLVARRIAGRAEAVASGLVLAFTYEFWRRTREISLDFWQLFFVMAAVYCVVCGIRSRSPRGALLVAGAGVPLGLALLCKPLMALLIVPVLCGWLWLGLCGVTRRRALLALLAGAVPLACVVALPWHLHMHAVFGSAFVRQYFGHEVVDRARGLLMREPFYFYAFTLAATYWPWSLAAGWAVWRRCNLPGPVREPGRDLVLLGGIWALFFLGALTLFPDKKPNYALPVYPALAWVAAAGICRLRWPGMRQWYEKGLAWLAPALVLLLAGLSVSPIQFQKPPSREWASVLAWLDARKDGVRLFHQNLPPNDHCYYYIKRGHWLEPYSSAASRAGAPGTVFILSASRDGEPPPKYPDAVLQAGRLVIREAD